MSGDKVTLKQDYLIETSKIEVFEEFSINTSNRIVRNKKFNPIIIIPKLQNMEKKSRNDKIKRWYRENREDINIIFSRLINIYYSNNIKFYYKEQDIYNNFVEFLFDNHI
tara:strand:- start:5726 stop:6055 length:330 start_codon:yes stop_codon:yes gene_type:complete